MIGRSRSCEKRTSTKGVVAGTGRASRWSRVTGSGDLSVQQAPRVARSRSAAVRIREFPKIIEVEPIEGRKARVVGESIGKSLRELRESLRADATCDRHGLREGLEVQIVPVSPA